MKYFTIDELCKSSTAAQRGIDNTPTAEARKNLTELVERVLDPLREKWGAPITVTSGYRCPKLNAAVGGAKTSQHCFDEQTELLTTMGWKRYYDLSKGDTIFSINLKTGLIDVVPVDELIIYTYDGRMMYMKSKQIDACVTDGHRMLVRYESHKYRRKTNRKFSQRGQEYFDSLKTGNDKYHIELAKDVFGKRRLFKSAGELSCHITPNTTFDFLKFAMAFVADGYFHFRRNRLCGGGFRFKKARKIDRTLSLLNALKIHYTTRFDKNGVFEIYFNNSTVVPLLNMLGRDKSLPYWLLLLRSDEQKQLVFEYANYDGCYDKRKGCNSLSISTTNANNRDVLQAMCVLSGMRCVCTTKPAGTYRIKGMEGASKESYHLSISPHTSECKLNEQCYEWKQYHGVVWCANNKNTTVITRRNGRVLFAGNCLGQAADLSAGTKARNKDLFNLLRASGLPFDQLIDEKGFSWVHVSYGPRGRREVLRYDGRRYTRV